MNGERPLGLCTDESASTVCLFEVAVDGSAVIIRIGDEMVGERLT